MSKDFNGVVHFTYGFSSTHWWTIILREALLIKFMRIVLNTTLFLQKGGWYYYFRIQSLSNLVDSRLVFQLYIYVYIYRTYYVVNWWRFEPETYWCTTYRHVEVRALNNIATWILLVFDVDFVDIIFKLRVVRFSVAYLGEGRFFLVGPFCFHALCGVVQFLRCQFFVEYN